MRKVFLEDLPKWERGSHKDKVNWKESVGYKVEFMYENISGFIEIIDYNNKTGYITLKYLDYNTLKIHIGNFIKCKIGKLLGIFTDKFKIEIGTILKDDKRDLIIIDREYKKDNDNCNRKWYKYKCNICGWSNGWIIENNLVKNIGCSCCNNKVVVEGINDIPTTAPWMVKYFQGGYDEAKLYTAKSNQRIYPICPDCGKAKDESSTINNIHKNHSIGCVCSDNQPYTEKFMYSILEQLEINFKTHMTFRWSKKFIHINPKLCGNKQYDFYFKINNKSYIIETHGLQHYKESFQSFGGKTLKQEQENDNLKEKLAIENGITNYIIIDCRESNLEYIKNNIINSELNNIFNLTNIDWLKCHKFALSNLVKIACDYKMNNPIMKTTEIGEIMKLGGQTISRYLKQGNEIGWCKYNAKEELQKSAMLQGRANAKPVSLYTQQGKYINSFDSVNELVNISEKFLGVKLLQGNISSVCRGEKLQYKGFTFKYI